MKIVSVVGARPQFIKAAAVSHIIRKSMDEILVHTGQHYDANMSDVFFDELGIPRPDYNLGVGSGSHGKQTAEMLMGIESILLKEQPDYLLTYGDTNSTLASALAASKLLIPIIHVEAGLRSYNKEMPEEQNRIITDHMSELLFCPTDTAVECLKREGICEHVYQVGDVMCDVVLHYVNEMETLAGNHFECLDIWFGDAEALSNGWYLATIHRAENTNSLDKIQAILDSFEELDLPVLFPVHPRTKQMVGELCEKYSYKNLVLTQPISYKEMLFFSSKAKKIVTDSGGLQKEAYILRTPCVTVRDQTEWTETLQGGHNILAKPNKEDILRKIKETKQDWDNHPEYYGTGNAAEKICSIIRNHKME